MQILAEFIREFHGFRMYLKAEEKGVENDSISALQIELGWKVYFAKGSERNIKLTNL